MLCLFLSLCMAGCVQQGKFVIEGELENVEDGTILQLMRLDGNVNNFIAVDTLQGGKFRFEG